MLPAPQNVTLTPTGISGELGLRGGAVLNARAFEAQSCINPANNADWENQGILSATRATLSGFTPGKVVWMRERATGAVGPGVWSEPVPTMVI